ncbi:MAG TPA: phosphomannomutase/phosphoglucomutase [Acidimicrobiia bacterium]|nr:phosphomannomutase/phosphoglucomutase [Acidimicrobiia bacterium]
MDPDAVFKAYDIRGRSDTGEIDEELYRRIGIALVGRIGAATVAVGRDCRATSSSFFAALADGIRSAGGNVIDLGEVPTDAVYYYSGAHDVHGAIITASHNPPEYNGLKLCRPGAAPIGMDTGLADIKGAVLAGELVLEGGEGTMTSESIVDDYVDHLFRIVPAESIGPLRIAADGGNGMAGVAIEQVFDRIEATLEGLYLEPDGTFPNHPADPLVPENVEDLKALMNRGEFDLGVAFDGDADRAFFLDDRSQSLSGSTVTSLVARRILRDNPGAAVVHNLITSKAVPEIVAESGGEPVRTRVGHSFIKQVMADTGAVFGGEHSGHYYFRDNFRADSGMLAMLYLLRVVSEDGRRLSEIRLDVERYAASGEINFTVDDQQAVMDRVEEEFTDATVDRLDGLTVDFGDRWFNLRPSNTEPLLRLNAEAPDERGVEELVADVRRVVEAAN